MSDIDPKLEAELERELPQPPKLGSWWPTVFGTIALGIVTIILWIYWHVAFPALPKLKSDYEAPQQQRQAMIDNYNTVTASLKRSRDIAYSLGYAQGQIDEMTLIMNLAAKPRTP